MKYLIRLFFFVFLLISAFSCTSGGELDPNTRQQVKAMRAGMNTIFTKPMVMIYDL